MRINEQNVYQTFIDTSNDRALVRIRYKTCHHKHTKNIELELGWEGNLFRSFETEMCLVCGLIMNDDGEWKCYHLNSSYVKEPCCNGDDCGCGGGSRVSCTNPRCTGITDEDAERILRSRYGI